jgi:hypothetical protein
MRPAVALSIASIVRVRNPPLHVREGAVDELLRRQLDVRAAVRDELHAGDVVDERVRDAAAAALALVVHARGDALAAPVELRRQRARRERDADGRGGGEQSDDDDAHSCFSFFFCCVCVLDQCSTRPRARSVTSRFAGMPRKRCARSRHGGGRGSREQRNHRATKPKRYW